MVNAFCVVLAVSLSACGSAPKKAPRFDPVPMGPELPTATDLPIGADTATPVGPLAPTEPLKSNAQISIVLPAGQAHSFAYAGFLKALGDARIPIRKIYATEFGSLVAALYVSLPSVNAFEWEIKKLKPNLFDFEESLFGLVRDRRSKELDTYLKSVFKQTKLEDYRAKLNVCVLNEMGDRFALIRTGQTASVVRAAFGSDGEFLPVKYGAEKVRKCDPISREMMSTIFSADVEQTEQNPEDVWVVLKVNGKEAVDPSVFKDRRRVVLDLNTTGIGSRQYNRKAELIYQGKKLAADAIPLIQEKLNELAKDLE